MGRPSTFKVGQRFGNLEILKILKMPSKMRRVDLLCLCHVCGKEKVLRGTSIHRSRTCGCEKHSSKYWKKKEGKKHYPFQLPPGEGSKRGVFGSYKLTAKRRNLEFTITLEEFDHLAQLPCNYCGALKSNKKKGQGKTSGDYEYNGMDRIDSNKGYTTSNVVPCCQICNYMKHKHSVEEFSTHIIKVYNYYILGEINTEAVNQ